MNMAAKQEKNVSDAILPFQPAAAQLAPLRKGDISSHELLEVYPAPLRLSGLL